MRRDTQTDAARGECSAPLWSLPPCVMALCASTGCRSKIFAHDPRVRSVPFIFCETASVSFRDISVAVAATCRAPCHGGARARRRTEMTGGLLRSGLKRVIVFVPAQRRVARPADLSAAIRPPSVAKRKKDLTQDLVDFRSLRSTWHVSSRGAEIWFILRRSGLRLRGRLGRRPPARQRSVARCSDILCPEVAS